MNGTLEWFSKIAFVSALIDQLIVEFTNDESILYRAQIAKTSITAAIYIQKGMLKPKQTNQLFKKLEEFETNSDIGNKTNNTAIISFMLLLTEEVKNKITNPERVEILNLILKRLNWLILHTRIDPRLDQHRRYNEAVDLLNKWNKIVK